MKRRPIIPLPEINSDYVDQYGPIDVAVYCTGHTIWPYARAFAAKLTNDEQQALDLMLRSIAIVSERHRSEAISNIKQYLVSVFKHCVLEEAKRAKRFESCSDQLESIYDDADRELEHVILLKEIMARMDPEMTRIFELRILGFSYNEIAADSEESAELLRTRFSRGLDKLREQMQIGDQGNCTTRKNGYRKKSSFVQRNRRQIKRNSP
jgi:DNA-directed RNA polymerase specialized sigma24 family protein